MSGRVARFLEPLVLLAIGGGGLAVAFHEAYGRLMNPSFQVVTIAGAALVWLMGLALLLRPRTRASASALLVFLAFLGVVALGRPLAPGVAPNLLDAGAAMAELEREGYEIFKVRSLFENLDEEAGTAQEGAVHLAGLVYRTDAMDAEGRFILIEPLMACCLADAIGLGIRVKAPEPLPDARTWVHVFGRMRRLPQPVSTPRFRMGAIVFTNVSRHHAVDADEVLPFTALLPDVVAQIPEASCGAFREALESAGLAERLRGEGPFTVLAPIDLAFDPSRAPLEDFVVPGLLYRKDLYEIDTLTTLSGRTLEVEVVNGKVRVEGARILFADQRGKNGVVHVVHPAWSK